MSKQKVRHIEPPKTNDRADWLKYQAMLRGEFPEEQPKLNVKRFLIISLIVLAVLAAALIFANVRLAQIEEYNLAVAQSGTGEVDTSASTFIVIRVAAIFLMVVYGFYALITLLQPKRRKPNRSFWGDLGIYIMLALVAVAMAFPLVFSIASSLKPLDELFRFPPRVFPQHVTLDNFSDLITTMGQSFVPFLRYLTNTVFITFVAPSVTWLLPPWRPLCWRSTTSRAGRPSSALLSQR